MSQQMNQGLNIGANNPAEPPVKRKRGRPRKIESTQAQPTEKPSPRPPLRPMITRIQGEGSTNTTSKGKDHMEVDVDNDDRTNDDQMVGQVVTGVLECAFDAGYFLTVRVGDSDVLMKGVVFKEGQVVPVTPENDIAPNAKMYKRREIEIPFPPQNAGNSSSKPTENSEDHQKPTSETVPDQKEGQEDNLAVEKQPIVALEEPIDVPVIKDPIHESGLIDVVDGEQKTGPKEAIIVEEGEKNPVEKIDQVSIGQDENMILELGCDPKEKQESPEKDEITVSYSNGQDGKSEKGGCESLVKSDEPEFAVKVPLVEPPVVDPGLCGSEISMENADHHGPLPEPPTSEVSPMETQ